MNTLPNLLGKTLLITGINGFLGSSTGVMTLKTGASILGVDLPGSSIRGEKIRFSLGGERIALKEVELSDYEAWLNILEETQPDIILHLAGTTKREFTFKDWAESIKGNFLTTSSMVQAVVSLPERERPVVVYPGSQMEYGISPMPWTEETFCRPFNPYGASKLAATDLLLCAERAGMFNACVGRFPILYGPAQSATMFIPELISKNLRGINFKMTEGRQRRRFLYVADAASFLLNLGARLLEEEMLPALLNMPASEPKSMREVAEQIVECIGNSIGLEIGAIPSRDHEVMESWPEDSQAKELGFSCNTTLEEGLRQTVEWYRNNPWFLEGFALRA
jgi:nucleoside-diphosphate-sugar epimerase